MILESEFSFDERVEKEIRVLQNSGFSVAVAAYSFGTFPEVEERNGYLIYRKKISIGKYKSSAASLILPFYFTFWYKFLSKLIDDYGFDVIHVHDLPLSKVAWKLSKKYGLKLVCDQHEFYSNWIIRTRHYNTMPGKIIKMLSQWQKYEKKFLRKADLVVTVSDSLKDIYINKIGVASEKVITLPNTPSSGSFTPGLVEDEILDRYKNRFVLFYAGGLDHLRGIDFIMETVACLKKDIPEILFLIAGKENKAFQISPRIRKWNIDANSEFLGWISLKQLSSYIAASNVCLFVPPTDNLEINNTVATKIYQYAFMGKPIIVSQANMMKEFVENNGIGYAVRFGDVEDFSTKVKEIYHHPDVADAVKSKAAEIAAKYNWENTSEEFIAYYRHMI